MSTAKARKQPEQQNSASTEAVFTLQNPAANSVYLTGDFNDWAPRSLRMFRRSPDGPWEKRVPLSPGRHEYKFVVDEIWVHDPAARENIANPLGSLNSVINIIQNS